MRCRDTERLWNELLDARDKPRPDLEIRLETHAATCPSCARVATRYRTLREALNAWAPTAIASAEFVERLHNLPHDSPAIVPFSQSRMIARSGWLSAAAAVVIAVAIGWRVGWFSGAPKTEPPVAQAAPRSISDALAEATSATLDLARETSAPAGRFGRVVLASTSLPEAEPSLSLPVSLVPTAEILEAVGGRIGAGVRPLSGSARQAFGFLIRTATGDRHEHGPPRGT